MTAPKTFRRTIPGIALAMGVAMTAVTAMTTTLVVVAQEGAPDENRPIVIERVLVKVNGEILTQSDLENSQVNEVQLRRLRPTTDAELMRILNEITPGILAKQVDELLMVQAARGLGFNFTDEIFDEFLTNARGVFRLPDQEGDFESNEEVLQAFEESEGITPLELRRTIERQMLSRQAMQIEILNKVSITDTESREYYEENLDEYTTPATAALREILIGVGADASPAAEEEARTVAGTTVARLRDGEDFAVLAAELSDSPSKANGGRIGPLMVTEYVEAIQELIAGLENGEVADPIRTAQGYQIVMLDLRVEPYVRPFDEVRSDISSSVFGDRRNAAYNELIKRLRSQAVLEWKSDELKQAYETYRAANPNVEVGPVR